MKHDPLLVLAVVAATGVVAQWVAWRLRIPSILVLLVVGGVAGALEWLDPDDLLGDLLFPVVSLSVALILFEGSLSLGRRDLRTAGRTVVLLSTVGAAITFGLLWLVGVLVLDVRRGIAALIAANLIVTGPTVVGPLLEQVRPRGRVGAVLRAEGIIIDPIGAAAAIVVFQVVLADHLEHAVLEVVGTLVLIAAIGAATGVIAALVLTVVLGEFLIPDRLQQPAIVAMVLLTFAVADFMQEESGLVAVTVLGLVLANQRRVDVDAALEFAENLQVLVLSSLFLLLAAHLDLEAVRDDLGGNLLLFVAAVLVVRPISVALSTIGSGLSWRERAFIAAIAPRGIVAAAIASIFSLRLDDAGIEGSQSFAGAVITVLVGTIIVYGLTARRTARLLQVSEPERRGVLIIGAHPWGVRLSEVLRAQGLRTLLIDSDRAKVVTARMAGNDTVHESVLSSRVRDELDLEGIGQLLAITSRAEINELAVQRLGSHFGRSNTWRLPTDEPLAGRPLAWPTHAEIERRVANGATIRATRLSERFDWDAFSSRNGDASPLLLIRNHGVVLAEEGTHLSPRPSDVLVSLSDGVTPDDG